jgi:3-isopropylmalate/(R)-2-methylmalate dehydratase small subunit
MQAFTTVSGVAVPLPLANVDTDKILPARFMKTLARTGLGAKLFYDLRYDAAGDERAGFALNRAPYRQAAILVAYENFGCGSSREHAPWALLEFGIRCVIAPSFGDIFATNCLKNGVLPVILPRAACDQLVAAAETGVPVTVDLERQRVATPDGRRWTFQTDPFRRGLLLTGDDEIAYTLRQSDAIFAFEAAHGLTNCTRVQDGAGRGRKGPA